VPKTVEKKAVKKAARSGVRPAEKKPPVKKASRESARVPVRRAAAKKEEKPVAKKKAEKKAAAKEEKTASRIPVRKNAKKAPVPVKEPRAKHATPVADVDSDAGPVDEGLRLIQSKPEGILQSELWKELGVDSRKCSRIVKRLEDSGLIERVDFKREGIKTYLLRAKRQPVNPSDLLAGDELIPCIGCELECVVEECHPLMDWMYQLAIVQHTEE